MTMASISGKKKADGKFSKRCFILDEKIRILHVLKKRKMSCRNIVEQFKIGKTKVVNLIKHETQKN